MLPRVIHTNQAGIFEDGILKVMNYKKVILLGGGAIVVGLVAFAVKQKMEQVLVVSAPTSEEMKSLIPPFPKQEIIFVAPEPPKMGTYDPRTIEQTDPELFKFLVRNTATTSAVKQ